MKIKVGMIQSAVDADKNGSLTKMKKNVAELAAQGCHIVVLPEMFCCPYHTPLFPEYAEKAGGAIWCSLSSAAKENNIILIGGSFPEEDGGKIYNTCFVFDENGKQIARHRKVHLFNINIEGRQKFCESETLTAGSGATVFDTKYGRFAACVCFDWRFPKLAWEASQQGAVCMFVPAAFNTTTGPLHWEILFKGRSVDNQFFSVGVSTARQPEAQYQAYGHSIAVSPWGNTLLELDETEQTACITLDLDEVTQIRKQIPLGLEKI